jgi:hypothetical protein
MSDVVIETPTPDLYEAFLTLVGTDASAPRFTNLDEVWSWVEQVAAQAPPLEEWNETLEDAFRVIAQVESPNQPNRVMYWSDVFHAFRNITPIITNRNIWY